MQILMGAGTHDFRSNPRFFIYQSALSQTRGDA